MLCLFSIGLQAQHEKIIHKSFEVEAAASIQLNIYGEHTFEQWEGNTILTETTVQLHDASPAVFKYYLENGRYDVVGEASGNDFILSSIKMDRKPIRTKKGECYEFVNTVVYYPEDYTISGDKLVKTGVSASIRENKKD